MADGKIVPDGNRRMTLGENIFLCIAVSSSTAVSLSTNLPHSLTQYLLFPGSTASASGHLQWVKELPL